ncbi:MAG: hypothetical protein RIQ60_2416 [Pseudomonadota bacterium]|jgi:hypothetical protein
MGRPEAVDLIEASKGTDRAKFLRSLLNGLIYDGYRFPTSGNDGIIGPFTISRAMALFLRKRNGGNGGGWSTQLHDTHGLLAAHLNFGIDVGQIRGGTNPLQVNLRLLHITVRRRKCQLTIDENGPTGETAAESIHMNRNTQWDGRRRNLDTLVEKLETQDQVKFTADEVVDYLSTYEGLTQSYMARTATKLKEAIEHTIHINAGGGVFVKFDEDTAWSGR